MNKLLSYIRNIILLHSRLVFDDKAVCCISLCYSYMPAVIQMAELQEKVDRYETEVAELKGKCDELQYDNEICKEKQHATSIRLEQAEEQMRKGLQVSKYTHYSTWSCLISYPVNVLIKCLLLRNRHT